MSKNVSARCPVTWRFLQCLSAEGALLYSDSQEEVLRLEEVTRHVGRGYSEQTLRGFYLLECAASELLTYCTRLVTSDSIDVRRAVRLLQDCGRSAAGLTAFIEGLRKVETAIVAQQMENLLTHELSFVGIQKTRVVTLNTGGTSRMGPVIHSSAVRTAVRHMIRMAELIRASLGWRYKSFIPTKSLGAVGKEANGALRALGVGSSQRLGHCGILLQITVNNQVSPWNSQQSTV